MSKLSLVFEADSAAELKKQVAEYAASDREEVPPTGGNSAAPAGNPPAKAAKAKAAPKKEEPAKEVEAEDPFGTAGGEEAAEEEVVEEEITVDSVKEKLGEVNKKCGVEAVRAALGVVKLAKVKDIEEKHVKALNKACDDALAAKK